MEGRRERAGLGGGGVIGAELVAFAVGLVRSPHATLSGICVETAPSISMESNGMSMAGAHRISDQTCAHPLPDGFFVFVVEVGVHSKEISATSNSNSKGPQCETGWRSIRMVYVTQHRLS